MKIAQLLIKSTLVSSAFVFAAAPNLFAVASVATVTPTALGGWSGQVEGGGTFGFVNGDAPTTLGTGSLKLTSPGATDKASFAVTIPDIALTQVAAASYWTKQVTPAGATSSATMQLGVDLNNDGVTDTTFVYDPQQPVPIGPVTVGQWQQWDIMNGYLWATAAYINPSPATDPNTNEIIQGSSSGVSFYAVSDLKTMFPNAQVTGIGVQAGPGSTGYDVRVDGVRVGDVTYDFEYSSPYTVPLKDLCKNDGWATLKTSEGISFKNQGQCVSSYVPQ